MEHNRLADDEPEGQMEFSIVSPTLTIRAMRDSGYKNTDHAIAELIDNSVEAGATRIEVVAIEEPMRVEQRTRNRIAKIAVADNGEGMSDEILRRALKFGDGTRLHGPRRGIGRFGIGLPNASISQCERVDVWTWQIGAQNARHCHLDLNEIEAKGLTQVPPPTEEPLPEEWIDLCISVREMTGTLVVWSKIDRASWRTGKKTLEKTEAHCGRVYRHWLNGDGHAPRLEIDLVRATADCSRIAESDRVPCRLADPLYLMAPSSTPEPFARRAMFEEYNKRQFKIMQNGESHSFTIRCAIARPEAINKRIAAERNIPWPPNNQTAGHQPWGKHANNNKGVSIVRADRELEISEAWVNSHEPEERWWSVEVSFPPALDEIFGVTNNKQHAHTFIQGAGFDYHEHKDEEESYEEFRDRLWEEGDPRAHLIDSWIWLHEQISEMRKARRSIMKHTGGPRTRHPITGETVQDAATEIINQQVSEGELGTSDAEAPTTDDEKIDHISESLKRMNFAPERAERLAFETVNEGRRVIIEPGPLYSSDAFFHVGHVDDIIQVILNERHAVYEHLISLLTDGSEDESIEGTRERQHRAEMALMLLITSWARLEDRQPLGMKKQFKQFRSDWGREAARFLGRLNHE